MENKSLGLIINLCFTNKYYDPTVFEGICSYKHIYCCTAGYTKREDIVKRFINTVDNFLKKNEDNRGFVYINHNYKWMF